MRRHIPLSVQYLFSVYLTGLFFFFLFRCGLFYTNWASAKTIPFSILLKSLFMGFRFDTVINGYLLALPLAVLGITDLAGFLSRPLLRAAHIFLCIVYTIAFLACATDIPFFNNFHTRLNNTVFNWMNSPVFMVKMILEEWSYLVYFFVFIIIALLFIIRMRALFRKYRQQVPVRGEQPYTFKWPGLAITLMAMGLMFLGIRGRTDEKSPIVIGTAFFSSYDLANQAGLNPVFTLIRSWLDAQNEDNKHLNLMDDAEAVGLMQQYLGIVAPNPDFPLARNIQDSVPPLRCNVVLVMMESMSADFLQRFGDTKGFTPNLNRLAAQGYSFDRFYSAGIHTFNGIFSNLYGFPALLHRHTMETVVIPPYTGLPYVLKQNGYQTLYFTTHDDQFDNVGGFLTANHFNRIVSKQDYPREQVLSTLGVPDHYMFDFALPVFTKCYQEQKPFFAAMMTASNHGPYIIPQGIAFKPKSKELHEQTVEYADWSIGHFLESASHQPWFSNTVFVFVADHGTPVNNDMVGDMVYSYNHIPFIIWSPLLTDAPKKFMNPGGQIDLFPTLAGLLHLSYTNNTMGIDLLRQQRRYICFSADDKMAVADSNYLFLWHTDKREALYNLSSRDADLLQQKKETADSMRRFGFAFLQTTQWLLEKGKTGPLH